MAHTLEKFAADCHDALKADPGKKGVEKVKGLLEDVLKDADFVETHLGRDADSERNILYEDPELEFCIIAHVYPGARVAPPHDHGDSWAIYGQAKGVTTMYAWKKVADPDGDKPGKAEKLGSFDQKPGMASAWHVGVLHSPERAEETRLIRIEGKNLDHVKRDKYEPVA